MTAVCLCSQPRPAPTTLVDVGEQLLATLIERPELLDEVPRLEPTDFATMKLFTVFAAIRNLQHRGEAVSAKSIDSYLCALDEVRGTVCRLHSGAIFLAALLKVNPVPAKARDAAHVRAWAETLRQDRQDREIARWLAAEEAQP